MNIIAKHPYWFLFGGGGFVLLVIIIAARGQSVPANSSIVAVQGGSELIEPGISPLPSPNSSVTPVVEQAPAPLYVPITFATTTEISAPSTSEQPAAPNTAANDSTANENADPLLQEIYSLIPSSFAPTPAAQSTAARTPQQQALYVYGNEAGLVILTFENNETNMTQVLKNWLADATSTAQIAQVDTLAQALTQAGTQLAELSDLPSSAQAANAALAQSLETAGSNLKTVAASGGNDTTLLDAMKTYNASADTFTTDFLAVSNLFSLNQVTFSASDPGSAFQFSSAGSL